ncbi:MAG: DNA polymerase I [Bdellovibrionaceae bacterium]|nr:DNA polymerase I [Pseudobdellovibrionaceae bacterium]
MKKDKIVIIDGSSYFFRAFFAIQRLSNSKGFPTNAVYGFINMLLKVMDVENPKKLAIAFDTPAPTFRKKLYPKYKANREAPPEDLVRQIPYIQKAVDAFGITRMQMEGYEADDVIATLAHRANSESYHVDIISGDKDLMQLVGPKIALFDTMKDKRYDAAAVEEKFGVGPEQMVDLLALMGDSSDNVPGVKGIGPKTAAELLQKYKTLDGIYESLEEIKQQKRKEVLKDEKALAYLSRDLVTLKKDVPLSFGWQDLDYKGPDESLLGPLFQELEFQNLIKRFNLQTTTESVSTFKRGKYLAVIDENQLQRICKDLSKAKFLAVDTETTGLDAHQAGLVGISLSGKLGEAYYLPVAHVKADENAPQPVQLSLAAVQKHLGPLLADATLPKVGQNIKYDIQILKRFGLPVAGILSDTMLASYVLDPEQSHGLDAMAFRLFGHQNISYEDVTGKGKSQVLFSHVQIPQATEYAAEDAEVTLAIHEKLFPEIEKAHLSKVFSDIEVPLIPVLADMEDTGVLVDDKALEKLNVQLEEEIEQVQENVYELAGEEFNLNSPKQLGHILFEKLKLPVVKKTKTGFSTDESVLETLAKSHPIAQWLLGNRELVKLKSTYVEGLLTRIHPETHRIHTRFNQTVAATGRLSSSNPNLQNIPVSRDGKYDIRSVFIPKDGCSLFSADYSQVELRLLAHMSEDPELLKAFERDEDVHAHTARLIFGTEEVSSEQRSVAKTINFGVIYGQTPYGLSQQLKISTSEAKSFIDNYFARYASVKSFMQKLIGQAQKQGYVTTILGRRRFVKEIDSKNRMRREMAERLAINSPLQGTAADMIKLAMIDIYNKLSEQKLKAKMILQVHDELVFEVPNDEKKTLEPLVLQAMEKALPLRVPLKVDSKWGDRWSK